MDLSPDMLTFRRSLEDLYLLLNFLQKRPCHRFARAVRWCARASCMGLEGGVV